ncbi:ATP-dependent sacrificial sulfur transferase LarE [Prosthecobacter sp.]|uniref:ATP-dependent sacrificial sulfur transferase LarE n=1 Tax=Prosthecobacter sp. TaxID=1965333 RepID=UPI00248A8F16|nr:ATP-dependent sacrificial sulfur transferase LarE [Prosthecobacter sp.]MDI1311035.1 ATP-dependent sacrificial sulfur transferase LarE [Prosthecobacter sp.]
MIDRLLHHLIPLARVAVAYSGGVDSTLVLKASLDALGTENVIALLAVSPSLPQSEKDEAITLAQQLGARLELLPTEEVNDPAYQANAPNRCYFCKDHVYRALRQFAEQNGIVHVLDGMNAEDTLDVRPGRAAARELKILSPLHDLGFSKQDVRHLAKALGLPNWDKPAAACLASRVPYGTSVTPKLLSQIERAEAALFDLGFRELRVRHHGDVARLEVPEADMLPALQQREAITTALRATGYIYITLDLAGLRTGSMNEVLKARSA